MPIKQDFKFLKVEQQNDGVIWILTIDHPPVNSLTIRLLNELEQALESFNSDLKSKAMILTAAGERAFSSGADINEIMAISCPDEGVTLARHGQMLCDKIEHTEKPVIVAINALCIGGGNEISMACHIRVASERAKFGQPEINLGIIPGFGGTQRLPRLVGPSRARKLILTGNLISAQEAFQIGLVDVVVEHGKTLPAALTLARGIIRNSQVCIRLAQKAINEGLRSASLEEGLKQEIEYFKQVCKSEDMKEGLKAYKEKRAPNYKDQ